MWWIWIVMVLFVVVLAWPLVGRIQAFRNALAERRKAIEEEQRRRGQ